MRKIILKHAILYSLSIPSVAAKVDSLIRYDSDLYAEIVNPKTEFETTKHTKIHERHEISCHACFTILENANSKF